MDIVTSLILHQARHMIQTEWINALENDDDVTMPEAENIIKVIKEAVEGLQKPFGDLSDSMKSFVAPMVKILDMFLKTRNGDDIEKTRVFIKISKNR